MRTEAILLLGKLNQSQQQVLEGIPSRVIGCLNGFIASASNIGENSRSCMYPASRHFCEERIEEMRPMAGSVWTIDRLSGTVIFYESYRRSLAWRMSTENAMEIQRMSAEEKVCDSVLEILTESVNLPSVNGGASQRPYGR